MSLVWNGPEWEARIRRAAMAGVIEGIGIVENRAIGHILNDPKTGRVYKRRGVSHQASAPGEAPASDQGTLVNSRQIDLNHADVSARLIFSSRHALPLEKGTRRMRARPFAQRSLMESKAEIDGAIRRNVAAVVSG